MRRISSVGSKNSFELSPIYTGHFRKPSRASAEPLTIEGMNAFVLRLMILNAKEARWGVETVDTTARMRGLHVRLVPEADVEAEWICLLGAFFDMSPLGGTPVHQGAATLKGLTRSSLASRVLCF
jgi:hypothetical protein